MTDRLHEQQAFIVQLGAAMSASGQPVDIVQDRLREIASAYGTRSVRVSALPTSVMVTMGLGEPASLELTTPLSSTPRLDQIALVDGLSRDATTGSISPAEGLRRLRAIRELPRRFHPVATIVGHAVLAVGLCLVLRPPTSDLIPAAVFGIVIGSLRMVARQQPSFQVLLPVLAAFVVAGLSAVADRSGIAEPGIRAIVASLIVFLPGAALATAVLELSSGNMVSGASRLVSGAVTLALLSFGIVSGVQTVGVSVTAVFSSADTPIGAWAPWLGVLLLAIGSTVAYSSPRQSFPGLIVVLYTSWLAQIVGDACFGGLFSALVGATVMTVCAFAVSRASWAMPPHALFLPGFWLLVPGAMGLIGLTRYVGDQGSAGPTDLLTTVGAIIGVALGVLCGTLLWNWIVATERLRRAAPRARARRRL